MWKSWLLYEEAMNLYFFSNTSLPCEDNLSSSSSLSVLRQKFQKSAMELELGLKITRTPHDLTSASDVWLARNRAGPLFVSRETDTMFILTGYLKGYRRENVSIKINEEGDKIVISGEKPVQEMVMMGWIMLKKQVEIREFRNIFRIPDGVVLNRIKAKFREQGSILTIHFPKLIKGISGIVIEEEEETDYRDGFPQNKEDDKNLSVEEARQITEEYFGKRQAESVEKPIETMTGSIEKPIKTMEEIIEHREEEEKTTIIGTNKEKAHDITDTAVDIPESNDQRRETIAESTSTSSKEAENIEGNRREEIKQPKEMENNRKYEAVEEEQRQESEESVDKYREEEEEEEEEDNKKESEIQEKAGKKKCISFVFAGSAVLASSLILIVLGLVRAKRKEKK